MSVGYGLTHKGEAAALYAFKVDDTDVADGRYVRLGETDDQVLLMPCGGGSVVSVPGGAVKSVKLETTRRSLGPGLLDLLQGAELKLGLDPRCPTT